MADAADKSIIVKGEGPFIGFFITEGMRRFPDAQWFDRTAQARQAIAQERRLIRKGLVSSRIGHKPRLQFRSGDADGSKVTVEIGRDRIRLQQGLKIHSLPTSRVSSMADLTSIVDRAFRIIDGMLD